MAGLAGATGASAAPGTLSWLVVGDWGRRGESHQREVGRAMETAAAELASRFVLSVGDNFYPDGVESVTDSHWKESFNDVYSGPTCRRHGMWRLGITTITAIRRPSSTTRKRAPAGGCRSGTTRWTTPD